MVAVRALSATETTRATAEGPMPGVTKENLEAVMSYHELDEQQKDAYARIQAAAIDFAAVALDVVGPCGDQQAAIRKIFEAKATLNRAVAVRGIV